MKKYVLSLFAFLFVCSMCVHVLISFAQEGDIDPNPSSDCLNLVNNLRYRDRDVNKNGEVSALQDFLQSNSYLKTDPTGYFGLMTQKAVKNFQKNNNISPTGYAGSITKAKITDIVVDIFQHQYLCQHLAQIQ